MLFLIDEQHLLFPNLMDFGCDNLSLKFAEMGYQRCFLEVENLTLKCLAQGQDSASAEFLEENLLGNLLADFAFRIYLPGFCQTYLGDLVLDCAIFDDSEVLINLAVSLVGIHDDIEILVCTEHLGQRIAERILKDTDHRRFVDILKFLELIESVDHVYCFYFLSHISLCSFFI